MKRTHRMEQYKHRDRKPAKLTCECSKPLAILPDGKRAEYCDDCRAIFVQNAVGDLDAL